MVAIKIKKLAEGAVVPKFQTEGAAGFDLCSVVNDIIPAGDYKMIATGLAMEIPAGYEGQVRPRSGLAAKHGISVVNTPGTVDSDYRGEIKVILINHGRSGFPIHVGDRIAQMVINQVPSVELHEVTELSDTSRGEGGFGSTGVK